MSIESCLARVGSTAGVERRSTVATASASLGPAGSWCAPNLTIHASADFPSPLAAAMAPARSMGIGLSSPDGSFPAATDRRSSASSGVTPPPATSWLSSADWLDGASVPLSHSATDGGRSLSTKALSTDRHTFLSLHSGSLNSISADKLASPQEEKSAFSLNQEQTNSSAFRGKFSTNSACWLRPFGKLSALLRGHQHLQAHMFLLQRHEAALRDWQLGLAGSHRHT